MYTSSLRNVIGKDGTVLLDQLGQAVGLFWGKPRSAESLFIGIWRVSAVDSRRGIGYVVSRKRSTFCRSDQRDAKLPESLISSLLGFTILTTDELLIGCAKMLPTRNFWLGATCKGYIIEGVPMNSLGFEQVQAGRYEERVK